jgi:uncharacterized protein (DUF1330 family)
MSETKPAYMVVVAEVTDGKKLANYQGALMASGLHLQNEGEYVAKGQPLEMFEGDWPDNQRLVIERFPSAEHARKFWYSDQYQNKIKPLRDGAGRFTVALFEES